MKKLFILLLAFVLLACGSNQLADMHEYEGFDDQNHVFIETSMKEVDQKIGKNETFAVYFGFAKCPWCIEAVPILNEVAKENDASVYYVNTRKDASWQSNIDIDDYDLFVKDFGEYVPYDENGIKHLYTPHVFFIKDGKVVYEHSYTVEDHDATQREMTEEEKAILKEYYTEGFQNLE